MVGQSQCGRTALAIRLSNEKTFYEPEPSATLKEFVRDLSDKNIRIHMFDLLGMMHQGIIKMNSMVIGYS